MADPLKETLLPQVDALTLSQQSKKNSIRKLIIVSIVCLIFMTIEIVGGFISNSLAIMTDAAHLLSDNVSFAISIISLIIANKPASNEMSYGYHRAEIIGAMLSVAMIWGLTIWIVYEAIYRSLNPVEIDGAIMLATSVFGLVCNLVMAKVLHHGHGHNHSHAGHSHEDSHEGHSHDHHSHGSHLEDVNIRAVFLHILGDLIQSIGVIIASIIIYFYPEWSIADTICSFLFSVLVICTTYSISKECIGVLMEASPVGIDIEELNDDLLDIPEVQDVHDLHVWSLSIGKMSMSCHLLSCDYATALEKATAICQNKYNISHTTIQIELPESSTTFECKNNLH